MRKFLLAICAVTATLLIVDSAAAGGGGRGVVRMRNNAGSQPVRVWVLTQAEAQSLQPTDTKAQLRAKFGNGVNLNGDKHHNFSRRPDNYVAVAFHTAAFDALPNNAMPLSTGNLGFAYSPVLVNPGTKRRIDHQANVNAGGNRTTIQSAPIHY